MNILTERQRKFIALDKEKAEVKQFFEDYAAAIKDVIEEMGLGAFFQDEEGTVYKTTEPTGTFVTFQRYGIDRTRRLGEAKGTLSLKEATEAGYEVQGAKVKTAGGTE